MSKAVLLSIQPKWCEKISAGKKTVEIRKSRPSLSVPFKCYIYCAKAKNKSDRLFQSEPMGDIFRYHRQDGKVVGEFVCDEITFLGNVSTDRWDLLLGSVHEAHKRLVTEGACMSEDELHTYGGKEAWHISALFIYDKPKALNELRRPCGNDLYCEECAMHSDFAKTCGNEALKVSTPPRDWCYVEEVG